MPIVTKNNSVYRSLLLSILPSIVFLYRNEGLVVHMSKIARLVGEKIRILRQSRGLSQEKLGFKAGLNTSYIGQVERGEKSPTIISLEKIANGLDVNFEELFKFDEEVSSLTDMTFIEKIMYELNGRTREEQETIYHLIKQILWFRDKK
ncbi:anaerobic benzoate catabolism transcriptional regulator [compost metagenome]